VTLANQLAPASNSTLSLDVIRNFFGVAEPDECRRAVQDSSVERLEDFIEQERASLSGRVARDGVEAERSYYPGGWAAELWHWQDLAQESLNLLLYYPRLIVHDPLAEFCFEHWSKFSMNKPVRLRTAVGVDGGSIVPMAGPGPHSVGSWAELRSDPAVAKSRLAQIVENVVRLAPLIDAGILRLIDQYSILIRYRNQLATSVRHELRSELVISQIEKLVAEGEAPLSWDNVRGLDVTPNWAVPVAADKPLLQQPRLYYAAKCQVIAYEVGGTYSPDARSDLKLLEARVGNSVSRDPSSEFIDRVGSEALPNFKMTADLAVKMRLNESDFEDWRATLTRLDLLTDSMSSTETRDFLKSEITPAVSRIKNLNTRRRAFGKSVDQFALPLVAELAVWKFGGPFGVGGPVAGALLWARSGLTKERATGSDAVLATILRSSST